MTGQMTGQMTGAIIAAFEPPSTKDFVWSCWEWG